MSMIRFCKRAGYWAVVSAFMAVTFLGAGCHSTSVKQGASGRVGSASGPPTSAETEVCQPGETVKVEFTDLPTPMLPYEVKIKEDGTVTLLLNQEFTFAGKTRGALEKEVRERYVPRYYKYMTVSINWGIQTQFYYVDGEVKLPARQTYIERTTVLKAIASAGGFTDFAKKSAVTLTRLDGRKYTINCNKARAHPELDLEVYPGDKVWVPRRFW